MIKFSDETVEDVREAIANVAPHYWEYPKAALASQAKEIEEVRALLRSGTEDLNKAAAALTAKDEEIERLKGELFDKAFDWRGMADAKAMEEITRLQLVVAEAALCIMENPHDAICDTIWLHESTIGGATLYEHLVNNIDVEQTGDVDADKKLLKQFIAAAQQEGK